MIDKLKYKYTELLMHLNKVIWLKPVICIFDMLRSTIYQGSKLYREVNFSRLTTYLFPLNVLNSSLRILSPFQQKTPPSNTVNTSVGIVSFFLPQRKSKWNMVMSEIVCQTYNCEAHTLTSYVQFYYFFVLLEFILCSKLQYTGKNLNQQLVFCTYREISHSMHDFAS